MGKGMQNAFFEATQWLTVAGMIFASVFYFEEISSALSISSQSPSHDEQRVTQKEPEEVQTRKISNNYSYESDVRLKAGPNGHFYVEAYINNRPINVVVDTGATLVALSYEDAEEAGYYLNDRDFKYQTRTANGIARSARITLDSVRIGDIEVRNVTASVSEEGKLGITLLGMAFLNKLSNVSLRGDELLLTQ